MRPVLFGPLNGAPKIAPRGAHFPLCGGDTKVEFPIRALPPELFDIGVMLT
jgi:hypothetical protein